jgi:NAD(P)H-nitrite reductase large subunit
VIIGTGGAGISAIRTIRSVNEKCEITAISQENQMPYSPCSLPHLISGDIEKKNIYRVKKDFFKKNNVRALLGTKVSKVIPKERTILADGKKIKYDKLLVTAGSVPLKPPITGIDTKGVFTLGNMDDADKILSWVRKGAKEAVVLGAGFIGVECAIALRKLGLNVSVFEMLDWVLPKMLDEDASKEVEEVLKKEGIRFHLGQQVSEIIGNGKVNGVLAGNEKTSCDMVVLGIGVRPNVEFLKGSGIKVNHGVVVDEHLRTSMNDIYAAGDIVEADDRIRGTKRVNAIWPNAIEQGRIAGYNIAGEEKVYDGVESINILDVYGVPVLSMGMSSFELKDFEVEKAKTNRAFKKLLLKDGKIAGVQMVGAIRNSGYLLGLVKKGVEVDDIREHLLEDKFVAPVLRG